MRFIKYLGWYLILLILKPIIGATLQEIDDGSKAFSYMSFKQVRDTFKNAK